MKEPIWIEKEALVLLHGASLARFGGAEGIRDEGLLDSALVRPINKFNYTQSGHEPSDLAELAATYAFGLVKNHPFVDGNKRAAFLSMGLFLAINGYSLKADQVDAIQTMLAVASGELNEEGLSAWIARNAVVSEPSK